MIRRVAITDHEPDDGPGSVCVRCGSPKLWHAVEASRAAPPCRRCDHDAARHQPSTAAGGGAVLGACDVTGCPCVVYHRPRWWQRAVDRVRGWT